MNEMRALAKIVLLGLAIYIGFHLFIGLVSIPAYLMADARYENSILSIVLGLVFLSLCAAGIYLLISRRDKLADKIVGVGRPAEPPAEVDWLPAAFRLVAVAAGLLCVYRAVIRVVWALQMYLAAKDTTSPYVLQLFSLKQMLGWLALLGIGLYFLCGAPHFVRWQVKKTIEQCQKTTDSYGSEPVS